MQRVDQWLAETGKRGNGEMLFKDSRGTKFQFCKISSGKLMYSSITVV